MTRECHVRFCERLRVQSPRSTHPNVKVKEGQAFVDWVLSPEGQKTIAEYKIGGEQLFFPNAAR